MALQAFPISFRYKGQFIAGGEVGRNQTTRLQAATIEQIRRAALPCCPIGDEVKNENAKRIEEWTPQEK